MISSARSLLRMVNPAYIAAAALVCIQVGMGILFKAVQKHGQYSFSISSSVAISEWFKLCLSTIFFYQTCWRRHQNSDSDYSKPSESRPLTEQQKSSDEDSKGLLSEGSESGDDTETKRISLEDIEIEKPTWRVQPFTPIVYYRYCREELNLKTVFGYGHLALLYATINNTVFVLFKLADPGTIQLLKSGITLITALVLMCTLGTKLSRLQWIAIGLQICGIVVTQYHPGTGTMYPLATYFILFFQVFTAAVAGVYNQHLLKSQDSSLHAQNMSLYAYGVVINTMVHFVISAIKDDEPGMFEGLNTIGAILVIVSNVLNGLAITAVYKCKFSSFGILLMLTSLDADALIKCFATAFSTAILLYVSPILFQADFSFLIIPGTTTVFTATWLYMDSAPPKQPALPPNDHSEEDKPANHSTFWRRIAIGFFPSGTFAYAGLTLSAIVAISGISTLHAWDSRSTLPSTPVAIKTTNPITSPFANTLAMVRYNSASRSDRFPLLSKYAPFFHTLHFSIPNYVPSGSDGRLFVNLTHDSWESGDTPYNIVSRVMQLLLADPNSTVTGLIYFHFDLWLNPFEFSPSIMDYNRTWYPDAGDPQYRCFTDPAVGNDWASYHAQNIPDTLPRAMSRIDNSSYKFDPKIMCQGWSDLFYIPRRFFPDWIYLSNVMDSDSVFHEAAIPTMLNVIDNTYKNPGESSLIQRIGDCWGHCCASGPSEVDIRWRRCGHKLDYRVMEVPQLHYDRLVEQAGMLGNMSNSEVEKEGEGEGAGEGDGIGKRQRMKRGVMELGMGLGGELGSW